MIKSFAVGAFLISAGVAYGDQNWTVLPEHASCLMENAEAYLQVKDEPIVIFMLACPEADRGKAIQMLQQNSAQPSVKVAPNGAALDHVIVYTQAELSCLLRLNLNMGVSPVLLPQNPCNF